MRRLSHVRCSSCRSTFDPTACPNCERPAGAAGCSHCNLEWPAGGCRRCRRARVRLLPPTRREAAELLGHPPHVPAHLRPALEFAGEVAKDEGGAFRSLDAARWLEEHGLTEPTDRALVPQLARVVVRVQHEEHARALEEQRQDDD